MTLDQKIYQDVQKLPASFQEEILDFIRYLLMKAERQEAREWSSLSLSSAMSGMEDEEPLYTLADLKVVFG
ncbi:hypothetical protein HKBW3S42_00844 [Candidatus Hakubella thermalkaliphila]|uniref:DUF2281 domain-containing protein n=1 Tax=Candidatus Hakubella thermalkaliphila TaxID=2754717 RepID=A0A6V8QAI9_9ACTN|nr:DUF2281 domain-containing protein [Candidatus Hakubella thermalkaliphila]MBT9171412.1 hypothetical protein [Actinomycetota bacterium]GFP19387.1 hypothetical protein HKBW3S03_00892 [Candidatus Hakubella thermalkaliphila]GFP21716.1 hypothetical protein HKBW3S06_00943 [Candidatus Hakubella thermalkaliphila]GFP23785.1 hypothetical protein HKBW3S09_01250 [Candidatus Hakubella thermalkaliphila]GFP31368.1 hypothetical protein HKBW3S34_02288 [Candidatus Hakubella thermalkaliphila]